MMFTDSHLREEELGIHTLLFINDLYGGLKASIGFPSEPLINA